MTHKKCKKCNLEKPLSDFHKSKTARDRLMSHCRPCDHKYKQVYKNNNRARVLLVERKSHLKRKYGITPEDYERMMLSQGGRCAICKNVSTTHEHWKFMPVDHDHKTGKVRGVLCQLCNAGLGKFKDNPAVILSAAIYLQKSKESQ